MATLGWKIALCNDISDLVKKSPMGNGWVVYKGCFSTQFDLSEVSDVDWEQPSYWQKLDFIEDGASSYS